MSTVRIVCTSFCLSALAFAPTQAHAETPAKSEYTETFDKTFPLSAGASLNIENRNGSIEITTWDKEEVHIVAEKRMRPRSGSWLLRLVGIQSPNISSDEKAKALFSEFTINVGGDASGRTITTNYPAAENVDFQVTYRITAPKRVRPTIDTVNGTVRVTDVEGDTSVETTNGSVNLAEVMGAIRVHSTNGRLDMANIAGAIEAQTTNGSVSVTTRPGAPLDGAIALKSTNGSIGVTVPSQASFDLELRTVNGSASCELPLASTLEQSRKRLQGTVGDGGPQVTLRTTNGSVRIKQAI